MKINFARVQNEDLDFFTESNVFGPDENGDFYYNYVEFGTNPGGTEEVIIADGCDRYMPICVEHIPELMLALKECYKLYNKLQKAESLQELVEGQTEAYVTQYYTINYSEDDYNN